MQARNKRSWLNYITIKETERMNDIFVILVNYMKELEGKKFRMNINIIGLVTRRNEIIRRKQEEKE